MSDDIKLKHHLELQGVPFDLTTEELHTLYKTIEQVVLDVKYIIPDNEDCQCPDCIGFPHHNLENN